MLLIGEIRVKFVFAYIAVTRTKNGIGVRGTLNHFLNECLCVAIKHSIDHQAVSARLGLFCRIGYSRLLTGVNNGFTVGGDNNKPSKVSVGTKPQVGIPFLEWIADFFEFFFQDAVFPGLYVNK